MRTPSHIDAIITAMESIESYHLDESNVEQLITLAHVSQFVFSACMIAMMQKVSDTRINLAEQRKAEESSH